MPQKSQTSDKCPLLKKNKEVGSKFSAFYKKIQIDTESKVLKKDQNSGADVPSIYKKIGRNSWKY